MIMMMFSHQTDGVPEISPVVTKQAKQKTKSVLMKEKTYICTYKTIGAVPVRNGTVLTSRGKPSRITCNQPNNTRSTSIVPEIKTKSTKKGENKNRKKNDGNT